MVLAEGGGGQHNGGSTVDHELTLSSQSSLMHRQKITKTPEPLQELSMTGEDLEENSFFLSLYTLFFF